MRQIHRRSFGPVVVLLAALVWGCSEETPLEDTNGGRPPKQVVRVPADYPTIQGAINSADLGDTVLVAPGVYSGEGNTNITFPIGSLVLMSENGPSETIIDCAAPDTSESRGFTIIAGQDLITIIGFTIRNARIESGGGIHVTSANPRIYDCIFLNNRGLTAGGAVWCKSGSPEFRRCTFIGNASRAGAAVFVNASGRALFGDCLFAFNDTTRAIWVNRSEAMPALFCCNIYGNDGGDWTDDIASLADQNGNMQVDPMLCGDAQLGYRLEEDSPLWPENNDCGRLIGAVTETCD